MKEQEEKEQDRGQKLGGKSPKAPEPNPRTKGQAFFTDDKSRIMPTTVMALSRLTMQRRQ